MAWMLLCCIIYLPNIDRTRSGWRGRGGVSCWTWRRRPSSPPLTWRTPGENRFPPLPFFTSREDYVVSYLTKHKALLSPSGIVFIRIQTLKSSWEKMRNKFWAERRSLNLITKARSRPIRPDPTGHNTTLLASLVPHSTSVRVFFPAMLTIQFQAADFVPAVRTTAADRENNVRSVERRLDTQLRLITQIAVGQPAHPWLLVIIIITAVSLVHGITGVFSKYPHRSQISVQFSINIVYEDCHPRDF